jgi:hypothetical protein
MKPKLHDSLSSRQDLKSAILEIRKYAHFFTQSSIKKQVVGNAAVEQPPISAAAADLIKQWQADKPISQKSLDELVAALENFAASAPNITITLAAPAPGQLKKELVAWCRQNITPDVLVDFSFNSTILGGMVVRYGSHIFDWSFKRQILAARDKFPEVLRHV